MSARTDTQRIPIIDGELADATRRIRPATPRPPVPRPQRTRLTRRDEIVRDLAICSFWVVFGVVVLIGGVELGHAMNAWAETFQVLP